MSDEPKHSPLPWMVVDDLEINDANGEAIAGTAGDDGVAEADARLIVGAVNTLPDLKAENKRLLTALRDLILLAKGRIHGEELVKIVAALNPPEPKGE